MLVFSKIKTIKPKGNTRAFSLMEVVVGTIIIAAFFGGLTAIFVSVRRYVLHANSRLVATNLGRQQLNNLYGEVRQDTWDTGNLSNGHAGNTNAADIDGRQYNGNFTVNNMTYIGSGGVTVNGQYRQVTVQINYPQD